ncbi:putative DMBT1-like protein isoform X2 [Mya arenaria]|nr:putative DMBT1-like protein isoform X2 [Mya arenaria]
MAIRIGMVILIVINYKASATAVRGNNFIMYDMCMDSVNYGSVFHTADKIDSVLVCAVQCGSKDCLSFTYDNQTKNCSLNTDVSKVVEVCSFNIKYVEKYVPASCTTGINNVRLCNTDGKMSGRVEVFVDGEWGTVCDDSWDNLDATVVCKMLGYNTGVVRLEAFFGQGNGSILLDDVDCGGFEDSIFQCPHPGIGIQNCQHSEDAGVECS